MSTSVKWPHLLQTYFSVTLSPEQQQIWQGELEGETNESICKAIRWASKHWKRPEYCQINMTTLQAWLYKVQHGGSAEQRVRAEIEYQRKVDAMIAEKCALIDQTKSKLALCQIIESVDERLLPRLAQHALYSHMFDYYFYKRGGSGIVEPSEEGKALLATGMRAAERQPPEFAPEARADFE